jgi:hypothetical protein
MWGICGVHIGLIGHPYLITGYKALSVSPVRFAKIYIQEVQVMKRMFPVLENYVDAEYTGACRLLEIAGFTLEGPMMLNNNQFYRFSMTGDQ